MLFSISCGNEGTTGGGDGSSGGSQSKSELVGTWQSTEQVQPYRFKIDDNGNINFALNSFGVNFLYYTGKIADTFYYPYTVEVIATYKGKTKKGTFKFNSASSCDTIYYLVTDTAEFLNVESKTTFTKK